MLRSHLLSIACAALLSAGAATASAADSPWNGTWKLDPAKSKMTGATDVVAITPDGRYTVTTSGLTYNFACDGKDYPVMDGHFTLACTKASDTELDFVAKTPTGEELSRTKRSVSDGGKTMTAETTGKSADGTPFHSVDIFHKVSADKGFAGTWQNTKVQVDDISSFDVNATEDSITFNYPRRKATLTAKLDGTPAADEGPHPDGVMISLKGDGPLTIHETDSLNGKDLEHDTMSVSQDGKSMTIEVLRTDNSQKQIYVYDKQ